MQSEVAIAKMKKVCSTCIFFTRAARAASWHVLQGPFAARVIFYQYRRNAGVFGRLQHENCFTLQVVLHAACSAAAPMQGYRLRLYPSRAARCTVLAMRCAVVFIDFTLALHDAVPRTATPVQQIPSGDLE